jgi:hypothetical protein
MARSSFTPSLILAAENALTSGIAMAIITAASEGIGRQYRGWEYSQWESDAKCRYDYLFHDFSYGAVTWLNRYYFYIKALKQDWEMSFWTTRSSALLQDTMIVIVLPWKVFLPEVWGFSLLLFQTSRAALI